MFDKVGDGHICYIQSHLIKKLREETFKKMLSKNLQYKLFFLNFRTRLHEEELLVLMLEKNFKRLHRQSMM